MIFITLLVAFIVPLTSFATTSPGVSMTCSANVWQFDPNNPGDGEGTSTDYKIEVNRVKSANGYYLEGRGAVPGFTIYTLYYPIQSADKIYISMTNEETHMEHGSDVYAPHPAGTNWRVGTSAISKSDGRYNVWALNVVCQVATE